MNSGRDKHRQLTLGYRQALSEDDAQSVIRSVLSIDGVTGADFHGGRLSIAYNFPEVTLLPILTAIDQVTVTAVQQPLNRIRNRLLAFLEGIERDHQLCSGGWHRFIEDIYMRCRDPGLHDRTDIRSQTWRKYK